VPATMQLLGNLNWWLPGWLDRLLPNVHVEGHAVAAEEVDSREPVGQLVSSGPRS
jgi:putative drug exporter of the RND superfamily